MNLSSAGNVLFRARVSETLVIEEVDPQGPEAMSLLREAAMEARSLYPELIAPGAPMPANPPRQERAAYFVAFLAGTPVGCGALRPLNEATAEVRRMYVLQPYRRSGVARALLAHLVFAMRNVLCQSTSPDPFRRKDTQKRAVWPAV